MWHESLAMYHCETKPATLFFFTAITRNDHEVAAIHQKEIRKISSITEKITNFRVSDGPSYQLASEIK